MRLIDLSRFEDFFNSLQKRLRDKKADSTTTME